MSHDPDWQADLARYPDRLGRRICRWHDGLYRRVAMKAFWLLYRIIETITGITLPVTADIGPGLRIWHFGNIIVHPDAVIGSNCTLRQGVTIGNRHPDGPAPKVGDDVDFGAYAQVLGGVTIGNQCRIGALSVVLIDVPDNATAVGNPARIIHKTSSESGFSG